MFEQDIAINRFGLGARPDQPVAGDARRWLLDQFARYDPKPDIIASQPGSTAIAADLADYYRQQQQLRQEARRDAAMQPSPAPAPPAPAPSAPAMPPVEAGRAPAPQPLPPASTTPPRNAAQREARQFAGREQRQVYGEAVAARAASAFATDTPFVERLVHFWANHFAVSADKLEMVGLVGSLEFEAIRPHVLGRFGDMLAAVERHPAMLLYLDQAVSVGPDSAIGRRIAARGARRVGLNENLAREIMELHTLGVRTGYDQTDVTEFARAMTGWTVAGIGRGPGARAAGTDGLPGDFVFVDAMHQPGERRVMGRRYAEAGVAQAQAILVDLAASPATATHLATKLARHFAGDAPPPAMVARLAAAYLASNGDLPTVYRAIVASPEAWNANPAKFKSPWEWMVSVNRALGARDAPAGAIVGLMNQLGQPVWKPGQPVGYDDLAASWAAPDAVLRRVEAADRMAQRTAAPVDARALAARLFPASVTPATAQALQRAESPAQALALLLVSPEMMRR